jgi:hypothetical protein
MRASRIIFRFEGREADRHRLDASDHLVYETAARQLLAIHAHFYVTGKVPKGGALTHGPGPRAGSFIGPWIVECVASELLQIGVGFALKKAYRYVFENLLKDSLGPIIARKPSSIPPELRIEPILEGLDSRNERFIDVQQERDYEWHKLRERSRTTLVNAAKPVGRSADVLTIIAANDNSIIGVVDAQTLLLLKQAEIAKALVDLGLRSPPRFT